MKFENCYKCGQRKLASINQLEGDTLTIDDVEMFQMGYGKHRGQHFCKNCKDKPNHLLGEKQGIFVKRRNQASQQESYVEDPYDSRSSERHI